MVKYLITSGNSKTGKATIQALKALGENDIVAGARDPVKSETELKSAGASSVVELDLTKPATVEKALQGVERVLLVHGASGDLADFIKYAHTVVDAAKKVSSVKAIGKLSGYLSDINAEGQIGRTHGQVFEILKSSGFQYFSVGPSFFFENWLQNKQAIASGTVLGASHGAKVGYIAVADIGAAAAVALKNVEKYNGHHLAINGDIVTEAEVLKAITDATGIPATYNDISNADYQAVLKKIGLPDSVVGILGFLESVKASNVQVSSVVLKELIGREPITASAWAKANAASFK